MTRCHETLVGLLDQVDSHVAILGIKACHHRQRIHPHGKVVKVLTIAILGFTDTNAAFASEHAVDIVDQRLRLVQVFVVF